MLIDGGAWGDSIGDYQNEVDDLINRALSDDGAIGEVDGVPTHAFVDTFVDVAEDRAGPSWPNAEAT